MKKCSYYLLVFNILFFLALNFTIIQNANSNNIDSSKHQKDKLRSKLSENSEETSFDKLKYRQNNKRNLQSFNTFLPSGGSIFGSMNIFNMNSQATTTTTSSSSSTTSSSTSTSTSTSSTSSSSSSNTPSSTPSTVVPPSPNNPNNQFQHIVLYHELPRNFLQNQIFIIKGKVTLFNLNGLLVKVIFSRRSDSQKLQFTKYIPQGETQFEVSIELTELGQYYVTTFPGTRGLASSTIFTVRSKQINTKFDTTPPPKPINSEIELRGNDLYVKWKNSGSKVPAITKVTFNQRNSFRVASEQFILSNFQLEFKVPFERFVDFSKGQVSVEIQQAFSTTQSAYKRDSNFSQQDSFTFQAIEHKFSSIARNAQFEDFPYRIKPMQFITFRGKVRSDLKNEAIMLTPDNKFMDYYINPSQKTNSKFKHPLGRSFSLRIQFYNEGIYIFEINDDKGQASLNIPIYVGNGYPLLPDYKDSSPKNPTNGALNQPTQLFARRNLVLKLINKVRTQFGVQPIPLDNGLNSLAQNFAIKMINQDFFGHVDPQGRSPGDRAQKAGIVGPTGQNLALNKNLTEAQLSLERSNGHLRNMVSEKWTRVGLGIQQNSRGSYHLVQQFGSRDLRKNPFNVNEMKQIQKTLVNYVLQRYPYLQSQDTTLSSRMKSYQDISKNSRPNLFTFLRNQGTRGSLSLANVVVNYNSGQYVDILRRSNHFEPANTSFKKLGLSVKSIDGSLEIFAVYN